MGHDKPQSISCSSVAGGHRPAMLLPLLVVEREKHPYTASGKTDLGPSCSVHALALNKNICY